MPTWDQIKLLPSEPLSVWPHPGRLPASDAKAAAIRRISNETDLGAECAVWSSALFPPNPCKGGGGSRQKPHPSSTPDLTFPAGKYI